MTALEIQISGAGASEGNGPQDEGDSLEPRRSSLPEQVALALKQARRRDEVTVRLGSDLVQWRTLIAEDPGALREDVVASPLRYFRKREGELEVALGAGSGETVTVAAVERSVLDAVADGVGRRACPLNVVAQAPDGSADVHFTTPALSRIRRRWLRAVALRWLSVACLPWLLAGAVFVADLKLDERAIDRRVAMAEGSVSRLGAVRESAGAAAEIIEATGLSGSAGGGLAHTLVEIEAALPEGAHVLVLAIGSDGGATLAVSEEAGELRWSETPFRSVTDSLPSTPPPAVGRTTRTLTWRGPQ